MNCADIEKRISNIRQSIIDNKERIVSVLERIETYKTTRSELDKSLSCLDNFDKQLIYIKMPKLPSLCVFLPLNQALYSLILFVIIPSCRFEKINFRPPQLLSSVYLELYQILELSKYDVYCDIVSRAEFVGQRARNCDCVIYTGKYENALDIQKQLPDNVIFIFQGNAANPIVISENILISDDMIEKITAAQIYNSGQDCMAPSVIFVPKDKRDSFLEKLINRINSLVVGDNSDTEADVSTLIEKKTLENAKNILQSSSVSLLYGGDIDISSRIIHPCIIEYNKIEDIPVESAFAPFFSVFFYSTRDEIFEYISRPDYQINRAYIMLFGDLFPWNSDEIIIKNNNLDVIDNGYTEFGGFGKHSGYISYNGVENAKPILILRELSMFSVVENRVVPEGNTDSPLFEAFLTSSLLDMTGKDVLEMGCGLLPHAHLLVNHCANYYAIDIDSKKIESLKEIKNDKIHVDNMDACNTNYSDSSFSIVLMFHFLHEADLLKQGAILKEALRLLIDGGIILIIETVSNRATSFQKCFDIVHEEYFNYKHIFGVQHEEWVIKKLFERGLISEVFNERFPMNYHFNGINDLCNFIISSFSFEMDWNKEKREYLVNQLKNELGTREYYDLEEEISVRILQKC